ncbi:hypothetical protein OE88DRAFT_850190 [Heliocybe sulcata]|uniref:Uncharacterized protein n=1 Tax=Heliocybe sulcata TaxID=5364 RepID=A0A5C3MQ01_9AGAM|nr:hypothetical protein OE88DRAFT_850190 [Heliocybe sulcata]
MSRSAENFRCTAMTGRVRSAVLHSPASPADGFDVGMLFVDNTDRGHSNGSQQLSGVRQWLADQGDKPIDQLGLLPLSPSVPQIVAPAGDIDSLPGLGIDVQAFGPPSMNYPSSNSNQGIAPMMGFDSFAQYREPSDPFGSGDQSPWSTTSESLSTSSPASHLLPALSYHLQPPVTVHGQGRRRSCSDPRAGGRDVPQPGINPSLVQSQYLSVPTVPTIHTVAFAPIPLPPVQGRPRASTIGQTHISPPCSTPASSQTSTRAPHRVQVEL